MLGTEDDPGIMPLTLQELFNKIEEYSTEREYKVKLWYLEIYNENIRDLLSNTEEYLDLREDPNKGISVANISELNVTSCKDIMQILRKGNKNRTQEATNANETSSRSHAILQVQVEHKEKVTGMEAEIKVGKLSLIDLAGSERASATQNRGIRLIEGANINRSLLTLGNCINALCEASEKGTKPYVPYRDSKLTRLLKDSLGGNSRTVMIANVSPSVSTFDDTYNTLKYANRAKNIKTHVQRNVLSVQYHISNYNNIITNLKNEITELKLQLSKATNKNNSETNVVNYKKEEFKEKDSLPRMSVGNNSLFEKCVQELKAHCEEEMSLKHKIIDQEQELNNLIAIIKNFQNSLVDYSTVNINNSNIPTIEKMEPLVSEGNYKEEKDKEKDDTVIDDKDVIVLNDQTNLKDDNFNYANSGRAKSFSIKEKENKVVILKQKNDNNLKHFRELTSKREVLLNNFYKLGVKDFYFEYLQSILKAHASKLIIVENKYKEKFNVALASVKESYINELENQVRLRDEIIKKQGINFFEEKDTNKIKSVEQLKSEYSNKLPIIPLNNREISSHQQHNNYNYNNNLPPILGKEHNHSSNLVTNNINSILSDLKIVNSNINKIEMNQLHSQMKKDKSKIRSDILIQNKEIAKEKMNQARNYSQGIRNLNVFGVNNNANNNFQNNQNNVNNLINNYNNYNNNLHSNPSSGNIFSANSNPYTLNQRIQFQKNGSAKQIKPAKNKNTNNIALMNIKSKNKDSNSEKSNNYSNNISRENENSPEIENSDIIEIENNNSDDESNLVQKRRKRNNHFHRKSGLPHNGSKEESPNNFNNNISPLKKDLVFNVNKLRPREDSLGKGLNAWNEHQPQLKRKDLNMYINDRQLGRLKNPKKIPFKI